jgi:cyclopropane fatty-acyl-phospholipid synthase-like methyltransferase
MTEPLDKRIKEHYDRNQIIYNLFWLNKENLGMHYGFWSDGIKNLHEAIINENKVVANTLEIKESDIVLDAGCGVGGTTIWIAKNYKAKVTGITLSQKQAEAAKNYSKKWGVNNLTNFYVKDFCNTDFPDELFTKILSIESSCHAEKKESFAKETFRILRTGGKLVVADYFIRENLEKKERQLVNEWCHGWEMPGLLTLRDFQKKLETAGFKNIRYIDKTKEIEPSSKIMYIIIGRFLRFFLKIMEFLKMRKSHGGTIAAINQYHIFKKRIARYYLISMEK